MSISTNCGPNGINTNTNLNSTTTINNNNNNNSTSITANIILQTLKRRNAKPQVPLDERVCLERAFGFTVTSNVKLTQLNDSIIAYLAG
jgi:hypothetical protein